MAMRIELTTSEVTRPSGYVQEASGRTRMCGQVCNFYGDSARCPCLDVPEYQRSLVHDL